MMDSCHRLCPRGFSGQGSDGDCSCTPHPMATRNKGEMAGEAPMASVSCPLPKTTKTNDKQTLWKLHHLSSVTLPLHWAQLCFLPLEVAETPPLRLAFSHCVCGPNSLLKVCMTAGTAINSLVHISTMYNYDSSYS